MRRHLTIAAAVAAVTAAACGSTPTQSAQRSQGAAAPSPSVSSAPPSTAPSLPAAGTLTATLESVGALTAPDDYDGIAVDADSVWVYNGETGVVTRIDRVANRITATIHLTPGCKRGRGCGNVAADGSSVWVSNDVDGTVTRIDPRTNTAVAKVALDANAGPQVYVVDGQVWTANYFTDTFARIDPRTNVVDATLSNHVGAAAVAFGAASLWLCDAGDNPAVTRLDPTTLKVQGQVSLSANGASLDCLDAVSPGTTIALDVTDGTSRPVVQIVDTTTSSVSATSDVQGITVYDHGLAASSGRLWAIDTQAGLLRLDPRTASPLAMLPMHGAVAVADAGDAVWVVDSAGAVSRVTPAP